MRRLAVGFAQIAILALPLPAAAQQPLPYIFQIVDQFMISNAVASRYVKPDAEKLAKFVANFHIVMTTVSAEMKKMRPEATSEQIEEFLQIRSEEIDKKIAKEVSEETCDGPRVKEALRRFDVQADMDLLNATRPN